MRDDREPSMNEILAKIREIVVECDDTEVMTTAPTPTPPRTINVAHVLVFEPIQQSQLERLRHSVFWMRMLQVLGFEPSMRKIVSRIRGLNNELAPIRVRRPILPAFVRRMLGVVGR